MWSVFGRSLYFDYQVSVILVISHFGFEGGHWVLIAPVAGNCILVPFLLKFQNNSGILALFLKT